MRERSIWIVDWIVEGLRRRGGVTMPSYCQPKEGCEGNGHHSSRTLCGVRTNGFCVGESQRLRDAGVAMHPSLRGCLERSWRSVLRRIADGLLLPVDVWEGVPPSMGHSRSLADMGTVTSRTERIQGARLVAVAQYCPYVRVAVTEPKGSTC